MTRTGRKPATYGYGTDGEVAERDEKLTTAVREFMESGGDMHELRHVILEAVKFMPIKAMGLSQRVANTLTKHGICYVKDMKGHTPRTLCGLAGLGDVTIHDIMEAYSRFAFDELFKDNRNARLPHDDTADCAAESGAG